MRIESGVGRQQNASLLANSFHSPNAQSSSSSMINGEPSIKNNAAFGHLASSNSAGHLGIHSKITKF